MRTARSLLTIAITIFLSVGVLCSQVCSITCAVSACSVQAKNLTKIEPPAQSKQDSHCHRHKSSHRESTPEPQQPTGPHDCPSHEALSSLPPSTLISVDWSPQLSLFTVVPFVFAGASLNHPTGHAVWGMPFRSPPPRPRHSILRI